MSTNDVPGANPANRDKLARGAWAEHEDGSLIYVKDIDENDRVIFEIYDFANKTHPVYYPHALSLKDFEKTFSFTPESKAKKDSTSTLKWTWHDKTPMPWERVMRLIDRPLPVSANAEDQISAAAQMVASLNVRLREVLTPDVIDEHRGIVTQPSGKTARTIGQRIKNALAELVG